MNILLVEDQLQIAQIIFEFFELRGDSLDFASDGDQGLSLALEGDHDVIILDVMLPGKDGYQICQELRENGISTPILMLTARDQKEDILEGFSTGADDYLVKPFDLHILEARITALYKRKTGMTASKQVSYGTVNLDLVTRELSRQDTTFKVNKTQFKIMKLLLQQAPEIVSRTEIVREIWGDKEPDNDLLRSHIYQLRTKLDKPFPHSYLETVSRIGYRLVKEPEQ